MHSRLKGIYLNRENITNIIYISYINIVCMKYVLLSLCTSKYTECDLLYVTYEKAHHIQWKKGAISKACVNMSI